MMEVMYIFTSQFFMILLVGMNQLNVVHNHFYTAMVTSSLIGMCSFFNINTITEKEMFSPVWWAFIIAGGLAIGASMKVHPLLQKFFDKMDDIKK